MTVNDALDAFWEASCALQVTVVAPTGNVEPEAGEHARLGWGSTRSAAVAAAPSHGEAEVHRVDHVRRVRPLRDDVDGAAEPLDRLDERVPLGQCERPVGLLAGVHEGVDDVVDPEVARFDHDVVAAPGQRHVPSP